VRFGTEARVRKIEFVFGAIDEMLFLMKIIFQRLMADMRSLFVSDGIITLAVFDTGFTHNIRVSST
jgi:hypothetical protein